MLPVLNLAQDIDGDFQKLTKIMKKKEALTAQESETLNRIVNLYKLVHAPI